jgi:hypothetical protein
MIGQRFYSLQSGVLSLTQLAHSAPAAAAGVSASSVLGQQLSVRHLAAAAAAAQRVMA